MMPVSSVAERHGFPTDRFVGSGFVAIGSVTRFLVCLVASHFKPSAATNAGAQSARLDHEGSMLFTESEFWVGFVDKLAGKVIIGGAISILVATILFILRSILSGQADRDGLRESNSAGNVQNNSQSRKNSDPSAVVSDERIQHDLDMLE